MGRVGSGDGVKWCSGMCPLDGVSRQGNVKRGDQSTNGVKIVVVWFYGVPEGVLAGTIRGHEMAKVEHGVEEREVCLIGRVTGVNADGAEDVSVPRVYCCCHCIV